MIDIVNQINAVRREVANRPGAEGEVRALRLTRTYRAEVEDVWDALTNEERIPRWFLPITGELKAGGSFQLEGNAGGEIRRCEPPTLFEVTFGDENSIVTVELSSGDQDTTVLVLEHTVPAGLFPDSGTLSVGPGWDQAVLGLGRHLDGEDFADSAAEHDTPESREYAGAAVYAWVAVLEAEGRVEAAELKTAAEAAHEHYNPSS
ncbi:SRPBCC family protein [Amycolatopsis magusensis]|uniref:SRPBCC family protein n=1 Tax=Amycolatopsis magusensis TaxID=882444 RepID=UPI003788203E